MAKAKAKKIKITLVRSVARTLPAQRRTVKALGLGRISSSVVHEASDPILVMVRVVSHLVKVEEL